MTRVVVDESGNLGVEGDYFVLAALVFRSAKSEVKVRRLVRRRRHISLGIGIIWRFWGSE